MVRSSDPQQLYWYARVLGIYHARVFTMHPDAHQDNVIDMAFLWVQWLGVEPDYVSGFHQAKLPMVGSDVQARPGPKAAAWARL